MYKIYLTLKSVKLVYVRFSYFSCDKNGKGMKIYIFQTISKCHEIRFKIKSHETVIN